MQPIEPKVRRDRDLATLGEEVDIAQGPIVDRGVCGTGIGQVLDAVGAILRG